MSRGVGEPPKSLLEEPTLNMEDEEIAAKLLQAHEAAPVDLMTYLCDNNLAATIRPPWDL